MVQKKSVRRSNFPAFVQLIYNRLSNPSYRKQGVGVRRVGWWGEGGAKSYLTIFCCFLIYGNPCV